MDYNSFPISATFAAGSTNTTISVPVTKDNIAEKSETFDLNLSTNVSSLILNGRVVPGSISKAVCYIIDNTGKTCKNL